MIYLWYILVALIPGLFWLWFYRRRDSKNPEPLRMIISIFIWGMAATIPAIALEFGVEFFIPYVTNQSYPIIVLSSFLIVAPIEEFCKYFVIKRKAYNNPAFDEPIDGIIYGIVAGLGFATLENFLVTLSEGHSIMLLRFATATLMHAITTGIIGYYLALQKFTPKQSKKNHQTAFKGLLIAIFFHGLYNSIASLNLTISLLFLIILMIIMYFILSRDIRQLQKLKIKHQPPQI